MVLQALCIVGGHEPEGGEATVLHLNSGSVDDWGRYDSPFVVQGMSIHRYTALPTPPCPTYTQKSHVMSVLHPASLSEESIVSLMESLLPQKVFERECRGGRNTDLATFHALDLIQGFRSMQLDQLQIRMDEWSDRSLADM